MSEDRYLRAIQANIPMVASQIKAITPILHEWAQQMDAVVADLKRVDVELGNYLDNHLYPIHDDDREALQDCVNQVRATLAKVGPGEGPDEGRWS